MPSLQLFCLLIVIFIDWVGIGLVYPMFSSMIYHKELSFFPAETHNSVRSIWLGVLLASTSIAQFLSAPILGSISDYRGRRITLLFSLLSIIAGYLISALGVEYRSLSIVLLGRLLVGLGAGSSAVCSASMVDISTPSTKARNFGLYSMACGLGFMVGPYCGGKLSEIGGFDKPFLFSAFVTFLSLILVYFSYKETLKAKSKNKKSLHFLQGIKDIFKAFKIPHVATLFATTWMFCTGWSFYWEFIPVTWITRFNLSTGQISDFYSYGAAVYALSSAFLIQPLTQRFHVLTVLFFAFLLLSLVIFAMLLHADLAVFWFCIPLQEYLLALIFPTNATLVSDSAPKNEQGEIMGILQSMQSFAFATTPLLAGCMLTLNVNMPIIVGGVCMGLAAIILFMGYGKKIFQTKPAIMD